MPREPWIKIKIGIRRSGKMAALPTDSARLGWFYVLVEAKVQRRLGVFDNKAHFVEVLGRFGKYLDAYRDAGLLHVAPDLCPECKRRHGSDVKRGQVVVHDYLREQRDPTVADRVALHRELHADDEEPASNGDVTPDVTPEKQEGNAERNGEIDPTVTADSRARATTATATGTTTEILGTTPQNTSRATNGAEPTLSKTELDAWASFGSEWDDVRLAWIGRGLRLPPSGEPDGDDTSQRGLLWQVLDAQPTNLVRWIAEAKGKPARDVVAHVLDRWHEVRVEAGLDDEPSGTAGDPKKPAAMQSLSQILAGLDPK